MEKKSSDLYVPDDFVNNTSGLRTGRNNSVSEVAVDEEAPLLASSRFSHLGQSHYSSHSA